ncbi:alpha-E domain-containing protein [Luteolibacter sp. AS25]|uniref:alpha-E domain-containing protein n=1 Tax=Luteolibacter sp. AS25 TaxID=3135776 RepID=UPI00398B09C3
MLSRVANTLYWMVRYVERADNLARLIDVNEQMLLDYESHDSERLRGFWKPIILSTGDEERFHELYDEVGSDQVISFLTEDTRNQNSIFSCISYARENGRMVRDQLSDELWEELNSLYLFTKSEEAAHLLETNPPRFYEMVRRASMTFLGIATSTTARDERWDFMDIARHIERADKTTRFLDVSTYFPPGADGIESFSPGVLHWSAILSSCGAMGAFRATRQEINAKNVASFLLFSPDFPRSVRYCIDRIDNCLHRISCSNRGTFSNESERESGRLLASLTYGTFDEAIEQGLHEFLDDIQGKLNTIAKHLFETYILMPELAGDVPIAELPAVKPSPEEVAKDLETAEPVQKQKQQ